MKSRPGNERSSQKTQIVDPAFIDDGVLRACPSIEVMAERLTRLVDRIEEVGRTKFLTAVVLANKHLRDLLIAQARWLDRDGRLRVLEPKVLQSRLASIQDKAAAFGYALARAEAEVAARPAARAQRVRASKGGASRGKQKTAEAEAWKADALEWAKGKDRNAWSRSKLAQEIIFQFDGKTPTQKSVEDWLKNEAEQPYGPIRSRARKGR